MSGPDLYGDAIVALARERRNRGRLTPHDKAAEADNPLCGDRVRVELRVDDGTGRVVEAAHDTRGCMLTEAAAAAMTALIANRDAEELAALHGRVKAWLKGRAERPPEPELEAFEPVRSARARHDCVLVPFEALKRAVQG